MKFLCDYCKAKYQIADEKVQGKTVKMKCRKCGHIFEIPTFKASETLSVPPPKPIALAREIEKKEPEKTVAPRAIPRPLTKEPPPKPPTPNVTGKERALASAFAKVTATPNVVAPSLPIKETTKPVVHVPVEEWYVVIHNVPVGPIRMAELRSKYNQHQITNNSLVWREGFEEWRPLQTLPELYSLVREGSEGPHSQHRTSILSSVPQSHHYVESASPTTASLAEVTPHVPAASIDVNEKPIESIHKTKSTSVPISVPLQEDTLASRFSFQGQEGSSARIITHVPIESNTATQVEPLSIPTSRPSLYERVSSHTRGISKPLVFLIGSACLLIGVLLAVILLRRTPKERIVEKEVIRTITVPASTPMVSSAEPPGNMANVDVSDAGSSRGLGIKNTENTGSIAAGPNPATSSTNRRLANLGPDIDGPPIGEPELRPSREGALDGKTVNDYVQARRAGINKACYQPYADRGKASVKITLHIDSNGSVSQVDLVNSSGESSIAQCIQRLARSWRFPASGSGGTFSIPFIFAS